MVDDVVSLVGVQNVAEHARRKDHPRDAALPPDQALELRLKIGWYPQELRYNGCQQQTCRENQHPLQQVHQKARLNQTPVRAAVGSVFLFDQESRDGWRHAEIDQAQITGNLKHQGPEPKL